MEKITIIEAGKTDRQYLKDLWNYRELFAFLAWRDILVRYKQTVIGILWAVLRPFLSMVVLTIIFGNIAKLPSNGIPYPILVYSAMLPWMFFANSFTEASNSLIVNTKLLTKIYFPRMIIPTSTVIVSLIDTLISGVILVGIMVYYSYLPPLRALLLPFFLLLVFLTSLGAGLFVASLNVKYRDFRFIVPFIVQFGIYISPVGFSSDVVPEKWRLLYSLNPMVGIIDGFRWCLINNNTLYFPSIIVSIIMSIMLLIFGLWYFRKFERTFADVI